MNTIDDYRDECQKLKDEVVNKINSSIEKNGGYYKITSYNVYLYSVEENIILWRVSWHYSHRKINKYYYTDLNGNLLFNDKGFEYATAFSNSKALIRDYKHRIIDIKEKTLVELPYELEFGNINEFRNDNLALFNKKEGKWGAIKYNSEDNTFEEIIPYIWDQLQFSREKSRVYVGLHKVKPIISNSPYAHWSDDNGWAFNVSFIKALIEQAQNLEHYNFILQMLSDMMYQKEISYIREDISPEVPLEDREEMIKSYISTAYDLSDNWYFYSELYHEKYNNNDGKIVDPGNLDEYERKVALLKK